MRKIRNPELAELMLQLRFTPEKKRQKQLDAAEELFAIIEPDKEYPFEFVFFRITGFHHKGPAAQQLMKGDDLLGDLQIFMGKLSGQLAPSADEQSEKVYSAGELAATLGISEKTVQRWRKRGLIARKFIFADGVKRLGFFQSTVDGFLADHPDHARKARTFSRLTEAEKQRVIRRAAALAKKTGLSRHHVTKRIAAETGRSGEAVRLALVNYEKNHPDQPIFRKPPGVTSSAQAAEIYRLYKQGCDVKDLMKRFNRSKSSIYRLINLRRAKALLRERIEFIDSDDFLQPDSKAEILKGPPSIATPSQGKGIGLFDLAGSSLPNYLQTVKQTPVLNREQEAELFRRYNYLKYLACITRAGMKPIRASSKRMNQVERYIAEAEKMQRTLIEANLRLVVSIARKHAGGGANLSDLISEGNFALMRAVEKFDYSRGFRFATFASWAIAKDYARKIPAQSARRDRAAAASLERMHEDLSSKDAADFAAMERAHQSLAQVINNELTEREQYVILNRFGPIGQPIKKKTKTLKQIGDELGLTGERVRQLELIALQKLRHSLSPQEFELLTG